MVTSYDQFNPIELVGFLDSLLTQEVMKFALNFSDTLTIWRADRAVVQIQ